MTYNVIFNLTFDCWSELIEHIRGVYRESGSGISIIPFIADKRVYIQCDRGGEYRMRYADELTRKTRTRLTDCL